MLSELLFRLRALFRRHEMEATLDEELRWHLELQARAYMDRGLPRDESMRRARSDLGGVEQVKEACRDERGTHLLETLASDLRYAVRGLKREPLFAATAILTLSLGLGATATVFTVVHTILLKPLPYGHAERIVFPWHVAPPGFNVGFADLPWGRVDFLGLADRARVFESAGAFVGRSVNLSGTGDPVRLDGALVSHGFFDALGVTPAVGRAFSRDEDSPGRDHEVVLGDQVWRDRFGADPGVVGRAIALDGISHTIVGVMPAGFDFPRAAEMPQGIQLPSRSQLWIPLALEAGGPKRGEPRELAVVARLRPGTSTSDAQADLDRIARQMDVEYPAAKGWFDARPVQMARQIVGETRRPLLLLLCAVSAVLLIVCANVADLLLARSLRRTREFAVRRALGASPWRLVRQAVTESVLLSTVGASAGTVLAIAGVGFVSAFGPRGIPRLAELQLDWRVIALVFVMAAATGIGFGVVLPLTAGSGYARQTLRDGAGRSVSNASALRLRDLLLTAQVALAVVLVCSSALLARSFVATVRSDGGFTTDGVLTFELTLPPARYPDVDHVVRLYQRLLDGLAALPSVRAAGIGETLPLGGGGEVTVVRLPDRPASAGRQPPFATYTIVSPGYFGAVGTDILRGRAFLPSDRMSSQPVAIVNQAMIDAFWPGQDVIGKAVGVPIDSFNMTIVGVVANVRHESPRERPGPEVYVPFTQKVWPSMQTMHVAIRTAGDPVALTGEIRRTIAAVDATLPMANVATLANVADEAVAAPRFSMLTIGVFGVIAIVLACVGLYGAAAYAVSQRTQEIGVRVALGAAPADIVGLMVRRTAVVTLTGAAAGLPAAIAVARVFRVFLFGVSPTDAATFLMVPSLLVMVGLLAAYLPARRAAAIDPLGALRSE